MRRAFQAVVQFAAVAALWVGCSPQPAAGPAGDGVLVLEVGGQQPSLRASLLAIGRTVAPPRVLVEPTPDPAANVAWPEGPSVSGPAPTPAPQVDPDGPAVGPVGGPPPVPVVVEPRWLTVELAAGENLVLLARRHLGDGRRYTDLLNWNGWTERDAKRLRTGQKVKIMLPGER